MAHLAIIGPGAIGCTMLGWLGRSPAHRVFACARTPFETVTLETPDGVLESRPTVLTVPADAPVVDWVLVATKTYDTAGAAEWLRRLTGPRTHVAILQNGVEHLARFAGIVAPGMLLPVVVDCPAERIAPGRVRQRGPGRMTVPDSEVGRAFVALFAGTPLEGLTTSDWRSVAWRKLCLNAAGAVNALTLQPARIAHDEAVANLMRAIVREAILVGRREGATLDDALTETVIASYRSAPPDAINSLHADRLAGRPMEIDARNGVIVRFGRQQRISTPVNETVVTLLNAIASPAKV
ncbi:2-dehydropantoate 2-reductase [Opitutus terrae]|uniref:2-dehydropantoate 2-reductase n=1 Tax=Opitutus terrae (strain DSM 11246 / JCM 15787 / PB90-1) TaxID=452637 RepID=B1ZNS8_OPITP|nr:2-dehydropantoate 2-reductase [Opitutus terrae]ACB75448.1 2-dehydropantoate 2-reductase [Opitutus terrae PB90-1]